MIIELGEDWSVSAPESIRPRRGRTAAIGTAIFLLVLMAVPASAPARSDFRLIAQVPATISSDFVLAGNRLFVLPEQASSEITAYRIPDERPRWRTRLPNHMDNIQYLPGGNVLLAQGSDSTGGLGQLAALDAGTGAVLWRLPDATVEDSAAAPSGIVVISTPTDVRRVDVRTGAAIWSHALPPDVFVAAVGSGRLVLQSIAGSAQLLDERSGALLVSGVVTVRPGARYPSRVTGLALYLIGNRLLDTYPDGGDTVITGYDTGTLRPLWQAQVDGLIRWAAACGSLICLFSEATTATIDPATGARGWKVLDASLAFPLGPWLRTVSIEGDDQGRLVDPRTGANVLDFGAWSVVGETAPATPVLLLREQVGRYGVWAGTLDFARRSIQPHGFLPGAIRSQCEVSRAGPILLGCVVRGGPIRVWDYQPGSP